MPVGKDFHLLFYSWENRGLKRLESMMQTPTAQLEPKSCWSPSWRVSKLKSISKALKIFLNFNQKAMWSLSEASTSELSVGHGSVSWTNFPASLWEESVTTGNEEVGTAWSPACRKGAPAKAVTLPFGFSFCLSFFYLHVWPFVLPACLFVGWVLAELFTSLTELSSSKSRRVNPTWDSSSKRGGLKKWDVRIWVLIHSA